MATERYVKYRLVHFRKSIPNPYDPDSSRVVRVMAHHGQKVSTDADGSEKGTVYGASDRDIAYFESIGALFPEGWSPMTPLNPETGEEQPEPDEKSIYEMEPHELAEHISSKQLTVDDLLGIVDQDPDLAPLVLQAEAISTGNEPREGLAEGVQAILSSGSDRTGQETTPATGGAAMALRDDGLPIDAPTISGRKDAWQEYARKLGLDPEDRKRDEIIDQVREYISR